MKTCRWSSAAIAVLLVFGAALFLMGKDAPGDDLASSFVAGRIVSTEHRDRLYAHDENRFDVVGDPLLKKIAEDAGFARPLHPFVQTPLWALAVRPAAVSMDFAGFRLLFLLLGIASMIGIVVLTAEMWAPRFRHPIPLAGFLGVFLFFEPLRYALFLGQTHAIFLFLTLLAVYLADRGKHILAGLSLAVAAAVKLSPGLLVLYWLVTRRFKASISFLLGSALLAGLMLATIDPESIGGYLSRLDRISSILLTAYNNQSLAAFLSDISPDAKAGLDNWLILQLPLWMKLVSMGALALLLYVTGVSGRRLRNPSGRAEGLPVSGVLVAMTLFLPIAWTHYFIVLVIPLMVLAQVAMDTGKYWRFILLGVCAALNIHPVAMSAAHGAYATGLLVRSHFVAGILLLAWILVETRRAASTGDPSPSGCSEIRRGEDFRGEP